MKTRVIVNLFAVLVFSALAGVAYGVTKIAPIQAKAGHPFTIIDTPQKRLIEGSVAVFRLGGQEVVLPGRTHKPYNTMHGRLAPDMFGGDYTVWVRQPDGAEIEIGSFTVLGPTAPPSNLITPYVNESDMTDIRDGFSSDKSSSPWDFVHDGFDIYPQGDLKPFQAVCSGRVHWIYTGSEQVIVMLACNSTFTAEYNFETQSPQTGQTQLDNIIVVENQEVSQGDIIGYLYAPNENAHVHFTLHKNWIPSCPEPYFGLDARNSMLNLLRVTFPDADMLCYGGDVTPPPLVTPYINESDMTEINAGFSSDNSISPWGFVHDGIDIYPQGDLKPFQASCSGIVDSVELRQANPGPNWQVEVLIECNNYVSDLDKGGYFIPFSVDYVFEPMSSIQTDGETQLANITVNQGDTVSQGGIIGYLYATNVNAHVHFGLVQFGSSAFSTLGVPSIPLCPEPHFSTEGKDSILNLLHVVWPSANMCY
jgi:hypothetical protein